MRESIQHKKKIVIVRGGGDLASGTICRLHLCGFSVLVLETEKPSAIRRSVSFCEAVYDGEMTVEGVTAEFAASVKECQGIWSKNRVAVLIDPAMDCLQALQPDCLVDAIIAKKNYGTKRNMAPVTIGLGPGFTAGTDVHAVVETARGHNLGRVIYSGLAQANSGIPGDIGGYTKDRVIYATTSGKIKIVKDLGSRVMQGDIIAYIGNSPVQASINGFVRGMIRDGFKVHRGLKIADIDPREDEQENCHTISDKARCISGGVLEALLHLSNRTDTRRNKA